MWRNHIYNIVINAFKNVADVAPQLHQLGYRDKVQSLPQEQGIKMHIWPNGSALLIRA